MKTWLARLYVAQLPAEQFEPEKDLLKRLKTVLRLKVGEQFALFSDNTDDMLYEVKTINPFTAHKVGKQQQATSSVRIDLFQSLLTNEKMEFVLQKAVELGVHSFTPVVTEKSAKATGLDKKLQRWQDIIISATEQCGRSDIMELKGLCKLNELPDELTIFEPTGKSPIEPSKGYQVLMGPVSGFSDLELKQLQAKGKLTPLGTRILRAETATIAACAVLHAKSGDFQ